jgi:hypothetical protein
LADARRGQLEALRGAAEVQLVGEDEEDPQLAQLDAFPHP